jgi:hypothetical protein
MHRPIVTKICLTVLFIITVFALSGSIQGAQAASYTMKAPDTYSFFTLQQAKEAYYAYNSFANFSLKLEGWACSEHYEETFSDRAINKVRAINLLIQPLASAQRSLDALEKALKQLDKDNLLTKAKVESAVSSVVMESVNKAGFSSEHSLVERAESLAKDALANAKVGMNAVFGYWGEKNMFLSESYGQPGGIWKLSKIDQEEPSVIYVAQNCYQKSDLDMMMNAIVSAAQKLEDALAKYKDAKKKALATAPLK